MSDKLSIVCWRWGGKTMGRTRPDYTARHVNTLASMVDRHLRRKHEVVCVTDNPEGIDGAIRIVPLWDDLREYGRCYVRLKAFARGMGDVLGERFVSLDLDTVITGALDPLFETDADFMAWSDPGRVTPYCGSQWMLKAGSHPEVFEEFDPARAAGLKAEKGYFGSDQAWMSHMLPDCPTWGKSSGVYSFRLHLLRTRGADEMGPRFRKRIRVRGVPKLPSNARIVHFHGLYDPSQKQIQDLVPWVSEHWR